MVEVVKESIAKLGIPGIIISILWIIARLNPITYFTSSSIELKLFTKDKRLYIRVFRGVVEIVLYVGFLLLLTETFFTSKDLYNPYIAAVLSFITLGGFIWILVQDFRDITFLDIIDSYTRKVKVLYFLLFFIHFISIFVLASYFLGTNLYSEIYNNNLMTEEKVGVFLAVNVLFLVFVLSIYSPMLKVIYRFFGIRPSNNIDLKVIIGEETWFIFHPVENQMFLLGDKPTLKQCTKIRFIEKAELLGKIIEVNN